jgi:lipid-A-disaccharide synthase
MPAAAEPALLVSVGEASGDLLASGVVRALQQDRTVPVFGMVGPELRRLRVECTVPAEDLSVMGLAAVARRVGRLGRAAERLCRRAREVRPAVALLVGFSEFNARLGRWLRRRGTRVLWYAPPQVWAWRPGRARVLAGAADRFALTLPFEAAPWRAAGAEARFVGHPAIERDHPAPRRCTPERGGRVALALLPGSRTQEVRRHWPVFLDALPALGTDVTARVIVAQGLDPKTAAWLVRTASAAGVQVGHGPAADRLPGHDAAVCASGTATLDCVAAGVPPVIVYRTDPVTYAVARRLVRVPSIGLPNLLLGRRAFPELVQGALSAEGLAQAVRWTLAHHQELTEACAHARRDLTPAGPRPSAHVAALLSEWLDRP